MYSVILVEDDFTQRNILKKMILSLYDSIDIYEADSELSALEIIQKNDINMFLIDINLKESSGLDLATKIRNIDKYEFRTIIFLTTHTEYLIQAFKQIHCYDYIIKPYNKDDVSNMLNKLIKNENNTLEKLQDKEIIITLKNGIYVGIKLNDIFFIEVKGKDCEVHTLNGAYTAHNISLKKILKSMECHNIIQSHRAFAVNKNYIKKIESLNFKSSIIYFNNYDKSALLGFKFKNKIINEFKKGKTLIC